MAAGFLERGLVASRGRRAATQISKTGLEELRARLKVRSDEHHYFCQSTERFKATEPFPREAQDGWFESRSGKSEMEISQH